MFNHEIAKAIKRHLEDEDISLVAFDESNGTFGFNIHTKGPISFSQFIIRVREEDYSVLAFCPLRPDADDPAIMAKIAEFVTRANYALKNGNFELDLNDGELRFKSYVNCEDQSPPSQSVIRASIGVPAAMFKRYGPGIINVLYKGMDPKTAVEECEQDRDRRTKLEAAKHATEERQRMMRAHNASKEAQEEDEEIPSFDSFCSMEHSEADETSETAEDGDDSSAE